MHRVLAVAGVLGAGAALVFGAALLVMDVSPTGRLVWQPDAPHLRFVNPPGREFGGLALPGPRIQVIPAQGGPCPDDQPGAGPQVDGVWVAVSCETVFTDPG